MRVQPHVSQSAKIADKRRAIVLLIVLTMLGLFAVVALSFVYYANAEAIAAKNMRDSATQTRPDLEPEQVLSFFLGQFIYGVKNDAAGVQSALRGHDLAGNVYDYWYNTANGQLYPNTTPFSGLGRVHYQQTAGILNGQDDYNLINYTYFAADGFVRDPGFLGTRANTSAMPSNYVGGRNAPYTYPDVNSLFLAAVNANGEVLIPSYFRPGTFGSLAPSNPNWNANAVAKYMTLRPRPMEHPNFPPPADGGGDVKNLPFGLGVPILDASGNKTGQYYNNDSIWIDIGLPVMQGPNGIKYKALVAPLIFDLDGKINLNVHGNIKGASNAHVSNQGWGGYEVNLSKVLATDWQKIFFGNGVIAGRYGNGPSSVPNNGGSAPSGEPSYFYNQGDMDGASSATPPDGSYQLPGEGSTTQYVPFPYYPPSRYQNGSTTERTNHPSLFNYFNPQNDDRIFTTSHMEALLRYGDTGSPALTSDLFRLCPTDFQNSLRPMRLLTTLSMDFSRPGLLPWLPTGTTDYQLASGGSYPQSAGGINYPNPASNNIGQGGEFSQSDLRSAIAALGRLNINELNLADATSYGYPVVNAGTNFRITDLGQFSKAQTKRQQLAKDIFDRLAWVTMGHRPYEGFPDKTMAAAQYNAYRWLAQLAVNIVDYRDPDDYITPFNWNVFDTSEYVFGTELPRVVLNEAYAEIANDPTDPGNAMTMAATKDYQVNFWVELLNTFRSFDPSDTTQTVSGVTENGNARLQVPDGGFMDGGWPVYKIVIAKNTPAVKNALLSADNTLGSLPAPAQADIKAYTKDLTPGQTFAPDMTAPPDYSVILPVGDNYQTPADGTDSTNHNPPNQGFCIIGPNPTAGANGDFPGGKVKPTLELNSTYNLPDPAYGLSYTIAQNTPAANLPTTNPDDNHTILLRRLACPYLKPNLLPGDPDRLPTDPAYDSNSPVNPYITVDVMANIPIWDALDKDSAGAHANKVAIELRKAQGRWQPYIGDYRLLKEQAPNPANTIEPQHTFFRHNSKTAAPPNPADPLDTLNLPFDWLVHLDRQLISPMELLHVSAYPPHRLTERFILPDIDPNTGNVKTDMMTGAPLTLKFQHYAPWFDQTSRIYRFLELVETANRAAGTYSGGLWPGKININSIWDEEVLQALCDAQSYSPFNQTQVQSIFTKMIASRTPTGGVPSTNDQPFWPLSMPHVPSGDPQFPPAQYPKGAGINNTFLRVDPSDSSRKLFEVPNQTHPYRKYELMTKIFNNVTTRSNAFAVFLTVGFFEVDNSGKLGAEVGKADNRHTRYRMFAIVDRSQLGLLPANLTTLNAAISSTGVQAVPLVATSGTVTAPTTNLNGIPVSGYTWMIPDAMRKLQVPDGMGMVIDAGTSSEETIVIDNKTNPGTPQAYFNKTHGPGASVTLVGTPYYDFNGNRQPYVYGHPGPQPSFDPRQYPTVVPYFTVIE